MEHQLWATLSGNSIEQLNEQQRYLSGLVSAVEIRLDLVPKALHRQLLATWSYEIPTYYAHFETRDKTDCVREILSDALETKAHGVICHSRAPFVDELASAAESLDKSFASPFHSQQPLSREAALKEFAAQLDRKASFVKLAVRAFTAGDALDLIMAVAEFAPASPVPVAGAIFGKHRWARIVLPYVGSTITFLVAEPVPNEIGTDDEQLTPDEVRHLVEMRIWNST